MHVFYAPDINPPHPYTLSEDESKHAIRVLRLGEMDLVSLIDGKGNQYVGRVVSTHVKRCTLAIETGTPHPPLPYGLHIACAPTKNIDRFEWFLEKATEIGISRITPLLCKRSERKHIKPERLEKILVSAMKQSLRAHLPILDPLTSFTDFVNSELSGERFIAHCEEGAKPSLQSSISPQQNGIILIGPEGDFSPEEIALAESNDFRPISLGKSRLRTETAALVACHTLSLINEA